MDKRKLLRMAEAVLYARRSGNLKREQTALDRLTDYCAPHSLDALDVVSQAQAYLASHKPIASRMGGIA